MIRRPLVIAALATVLLLPISACTAGPGPAGPTGGDAAFPDEAVADTDRAAPSGVGRSDARQPARGGTHPADEPLVLGPGVR